MTISEFCFALNNETKALHKHPNTSFYPFSFNSPSDIVFRPYNLTLEGKQLDSFICEKRNLVEKEGYKFLICPMPYLVKAPYAKYITVEEYFAFKKKEEKKMTINELCDLLNKDTNHLKTKGFHHWWVFTADFQEKERVNCWSFVLDLEVEKLNDFIRAKRDVVKEAGFELNIIPKYVSDGEWQIIPVDKYLEENKKQSINELVATLNKETRKNNIDNDTHAFNFNSIDFQDAKLRTDFKDNIVFYPITVNLTGQELDSFICEKRNLVEKEGYKFLISDSKSRKYLTINEYFDLKSLNEQLVKKSIKEVHDEIAKDAKKRFGEYITSCSEFGSKITVYLQTPYYGIIPNDFIIEAKNKVEKEGYGFVISYNSKDMSFDEYLDLRKIEKIKEFCAKLNDETQKDYNRAPFSFNEKTNEVYIYTHSNDNIPKGFIIEAKNKVEKEGYEFVVAYGEHITADEYLKKTKQPLTVAQHLEDFQHFKDELYTKLCSPKAVLIPDPSNCTESPNSTTNEFPNAEQIIDRNPYEQGMKHENWSKYWGKIKLNDFIRQTKDTKNTDQLRRNAMLKQKAEREALRVKKYDLLRLIGTQGIVDITDIDNPEGVTVVEISAYGCNTAEIYKLGFKVREIKNASFFQSLKEDWRYLPKFNKYILSGSLATILLAPIIFTCVNFGKIPIAISSKIIHEGILEKIEENKYTFKDGSSFILEKDKVSGIIPKGVKVELIQDIWGRYRFERKVK